MKVFDHIDFNNFFESNIKNDITLPRFEQTPCFEEIFLNSLNGLLVEMAAGVTPGSGTSAAVRLDDADIQYLYQFMPSDWSKALWWRYGPGLINYARSRHSHVPEHEDDDENSHFHGVDKKNIPHPKEARGSIQFDEDILLGKTRTARSQIQNDPKLGGSDGKAKLAWMRPEGGFTKDQKFKESGAIKGKRKYTNIQFGWNELYHKLNRKYKFAMQRVDDRYWHSKGQLPQLAGYKPMNFKGVDDDLNNYFKALGMAYHHPQGHHDNLNNHQLSTLQGQHGYDAQAGFTSNDHISPHDIVPLTQGTHNDGKWNQGHPTASAEGTHTLQNSEEGAHYTDHMYDLMSKGLGRRYSSRDRKVQPYHLGSPKPGANSSYNAYEVFGLHKAMKLQEWELEKYFPQELHQWAYDQMKATAEGRTDGKRSTKADKALARQASGLVGEPVNISEDQEFLTQLAKQRMRWQRIEPDRVSDYSQDRVRNINGQMHAAVEDEFIREAVGKSTLPKWQYLFLKRYCNRFGSQRTNQLTHNQHNGVTSIYRSIPASVINDTVGNHPELGFAHDALTHKRSHQDLQDLHDRDLEQSHGTTGNKKEVHTQKGFKLSDKYVNHREGQKTSPKTADELTQASHTDVMVGGVWHNFGGPDGNIWEINNKTNKWEEIVKQRIFVPLLHRGQVLSSEKQVSKGINVGAFGHSQVAEVQTNHFGNNADDDEFEVSKETAQKYHEEVPYEERDGRYFVNRNKYFWASAEAGEEPDQEFFSQDDAKHNDVTRTTDHHHGHMGGDAEPDPDGLVRYNTDVTRSKKKKGFIICGVPDEAGTPVLKSVHDGVQDALNSLKGNEMLFDELSGELNALWAYGIQLLKANVGHPQFFKNSEYENHLKKEMEDMPKDEDDKIDVQALRVSGLQWEGTPATGYTYRRRRVANYIGSFSQRKLSENIPQRRSREGRTSGFVRGIEDHDLKRMANTHIESQEQDEIVKRRAGVRKHTDETPWGLATAQSSYHRRVEGFLSAYQDAEDKFDIRSGGEIQALAEPAKSSNFAMLCLWAIESGQVPTAREIAQDKELMSKPVSEAEATAQHFPETNPHQYHEALAEQFKLAWAWAKQKQEADWKERLSKSLKAGTWHNGATGVIPNADFVEFHSKEDPIAELFQRSSEYDARASVDLVKSELDHSDIGQDEKGQAYHAVYQILEQRHPHGLFDFTQDDEEVDSNFDRKFGESVSGLFKVPDEGNALQAAHAAADFLLNGINVNTISSKDQMGKIKDKVESNGTSFEHMLESSSHGSVEALAPRFKRDLGYRLKHIEQSYSGIESPTDRSLTNHLISSIGKQHEAGKTQTLSQYDHQIEEAGEKVAAMANKNQGKDHDSRLDKLKGTHDQLKKSREGYLLSYDRVTSVLHQTAFNLDSVKQIATMAGETKQKYILKALEDAFLDQVVKHLSHAHHWYENAHNVVASAKYLKDILGDKFYASFKNEVTHIKKGHDNAYGDTA
tara:strand:+ start:19477 stop:23928 length:4452 start_codon:yes stop_codon:yes gene_type:complete